MKRFWFPLPFAFLLSLLMLTSLWLLLRSPVVFAVESPASPDLPGSISGRVVDRNGTPIVGVRVEAMTQLTTKSSYYAISDKNGVYKILALGPGIYRVRFTDWERRYAPQFYAGAKTFEEAIPLPVAGNHLTGIDAVLRSGMITGKITLLTETIPVDLLSPPPDIIQHTVYAHKQLPDSESWLVGSTTYITGFTSVYTLTGLATNQYVVCASTEFTYLPDHQSKYVASECYDNVSHHAAKKIAVVEGETVSGIDFVMGDGVDYAQIQGRVTTLTGEPISDTVVSIRTLQEEVFNPKYTQKTDKNGYYTATVASEIYTFTVYFADPQERYVNAYYKDALYKAEATRITPTARQVITNISAQLAPAAVITGVVTLFGEKPSSNWIIYADQKVNIKWRTFYQEQLTTRGQYQIPGLPAGTFRICAIFSALSSGCFGSSDRETATEVVVNQGQLLSNVDFDANYDFFSQSISGVVMGDGHPLDRVKVELYDLSYLLVYTYTNQSGQYQFAGLSKGSDYALLFKDESGEFATAYYSPDGPSDRFWRLSVYTPTVLSNVSMNLPLGGSITGTLQLETGEPLSNALVILYRYDELFGRYYQSSLWRTRTDAQGNYAVKQIIPGSYRVQFGSNVGSPFGRYSYEFYGAQNRRNDVNDAQDVIVNPKQVTGGINHTFGADYLIFLPILNR